MQPVGAPEARRGATTAAKAKAGTSTDAADLDIQAWYLLHEGFSDIPEEIVRHIYNIYVCNILKLLPSCLAVVDVRPLSSLVWSGRNWRAV